MKNSQSFRVSGSARVTVGDVNQTVNLSDPPDPAGKEVRPVRVLFLAANPAKTSRLRLDREVRTIEEALRSADQPGRFELEQSWAVGLREIQDSLLRYQPDIVHLSGHGSSSGGLILEKDSLSRDVSVDRVKAAATEEAEAQALPRIFAAARGSIRCVVLNACYSEAAAQGIAEYVDCVVGMSSRIPDEAAIRFSWAFYNALGHGLSIKRAFDLACAQCGLGAGGDVPRLLATRHDASEVQLTTEAGKRR
jgi:hypothetical protein